MQTHRVFNHIFITYKVWIKFNIVVQRNKFTEVWDVSQVLGRSRLILWEINDWIQDSNSKSLNLSKATQIIKKRIAYGAYQKPGEVNVKTHLECDTVDNLLELWPGQLWSVTTLWDLTPTFYLTSFFVALNMYISTWLE